MMIPTSEIKSNSDTEIQPASEKPHVKTLADRVFEIDEGQGRRFARLTGEALEIATKGITRHFNACERFNVPVDPFALREIITDAAHGLKYFD
jgi:hypothetical protein